MDYDDFNEKYKNLVYAPLELDLPDLDLDKFLAYSFAHRKELIYDPYLYSMNKFSPNEPIVGLNEYLESTGKSFWITFYPWLDGKWLADFDKKFPELVDMFNKLPMPTFGALGYLYQNNEFNLTDSGPVHFDEREGLGIRITFGEDTHGIFFHRPKESLNQLDLNNFMLKKTSNIDTLDIYGEFEIKNGRYVVNENILDPTRIYAQPPNKTKQAFILTNQLAPHAVLKRKGHSITFASFGRKNHKERFYWDRLDKLLTTSMIKNPNSFIWL